MERKSEMKGKNEIEIERERDIIRDNDSEGEM